MRTIKVKWYHSKSSGRRFPYSSLVSNITKTGNTLSFKINNPGANMQTDTANFEALALMCRCYEPGCMVRIDFARQGWYEKRNDKVEEFKGWNGKFGNLSPGSKAYLRFLYRAHMFKKAYPDWVSFPSEASDEIRKFTELMEASTPRNNVPGSIANFKSSKGAEHVIEKKFAHSKRGRAYLRDLYTNKTGAHLDEINSQLPNGLFNTEPSESTRIFTTGYYDIWGIDDKGDFCVFELKKKDNMKLGVISELFFYASYAHDVLLNKDRLYEPLNVNYRGYNHLYNYVLNSEKKNVNAFFLLAEGGVHEYINMNSAKLLEEMNANTLGIRFDFMYYKPEKLELDKEEEISIDIKRAEA